VVVKHISLAHLGGYYFYRIHEGKLDGYCKLNSEYGKLKNYLEEVFSDCPNSYFNGGPRGSSLKFKTGHEMHEVLGHEVCAMAKSGLKVNEKRFKSNHSKVQLFMLENDGNTIAVEVPIWLSPGELKEYEQLFGKEGPLTGHIDVLGLEKDKIWVWDYKPNAHREKYACTQVYFYSLMLSKRSGIPLEKFRCGYFDVDRAYVFKPDEIDKKDFQTKIN
jgi:hypothetical protein